MYFNMASPKQIIFIKVCLKRIITMISLGMIIQNWYDT